MPDETPVIPAASDAPAAAPMTIEAELRAAFSESPAVEAETAAAAPEAAVEPQVVATSEEPAKPAEPTLARRLAMLAAAERRGKAEAATRAAEEAARKPDLDRLAASKAAKTKMEQAKIALGLDDEGMADLFLELHQHHAGEKQTRDPAVVIEELVSKKLSEVMEARESANAAAQAAALETHRVEYTAETLAVLEEKGDEFPLVAIAAPSQGDITAISEAWLAAKGEIPGPEIVLKLIQDERQSKLDARRKPETKTPSKQPAVAASATETSGSKAKPTVARNDVPVTAPRKLTIEEELRAAFNLS